MKTTLNLRIYIKLIIAATLLLGSVQAAQFKVEKKTVISIASLLESKNDKSESAISLGLSKILGQDQAIQDFGQMILDLCLNPTKYNFPSGGINKEECTLEKASERVQDDLAFTLAENFSKEVRADKVEVYLNTFLNTYLDKMKAVIEAFNSWM